MLQRTYISSPPPYLTYALSKAENFLLRPRNMHITYTPRETHTQRESARHRDPHREAVHNDWIRYPRLVM